MFRCFLVLGRYIGDLEAALLSLVLHILLALVLDGHASAASELAATAIAPAGAGATAAPLLAEYADELLVGVVFHVEQARVLSAVTADRNKEASVFYNEICFKLWHDIMR